MIKRVTRKSTNTGGEELGRKLLQSIKEMKAGKVARTTSVAPNQVAAARLKTGLSQAQFAKALRISARTLQEWEQGGRQPDSAARAYLTVIAKEPAMVRRALASE